MRLRIARRLFGNTIRLASNSRNQWRWWNIFWNNKPFRSVRSQYWRVSGGANGKNLHHWFCQNQTRWISQGLRNSGLNLLELPASLNNWAGGRLTRELAIRTSILTILGVTGYSSGKATQVLLNRLDPSSSRGSKTDSLTPDTESFTKASGINDANLSRGLISPVNTPSGGSKSSVK